MKLTNDSVCRNVSAILTVLILTLCFVRSARAQVASNLPYTLEQSVIAGGGGTSTDAGNTFSITGTIGQAVTGASGASAFQIKSGFFTAAPAAPTAALVTVSGRVMSGRRGAANAVVKLVGADGTIQRALTDALGNYRFNNVAAGETYIFTASIKRIEFAPQVVYVTEEVQGLNFTSQ